MVLKPEETQGIVCPLCKKDVADKVATHAEFEHSSIFFCRNCGLGFVRPAPNEKDLEHYYQESYRQKRHERPKGSYFRGVARRAHAQYKFLNTNILISNPAIQDVIDIGAGPGLLMKHLRDAGLSLVGFEPDLIMSQYAMSNLGLEVHPTSFSVEIVRELGLPAVDMICMSHVLEHISQPVEFLKEVGSTLKHGGTLFIEVPHETPEKVIKMSELGTNSAHLTFFNSKTLKTTLEEAGFIDISLFDCGRSLDSLVHRLSRRPRLWERIMWRLTGMGDVYADSAYTRICEPGHNGEKRVVLRALATKG